MDDSKAYSSDIAFTPSVKAVQTRKGSRAANAQREANGAWPTVITPDLAAYIAAQTSVMLATASAAGQPYVQHRGGPAGFLHVLDENTIAFADFTGNRQFITTGNLAENPRVCLFLMDYSRRRRIKLWGKAQVIEGDDALIGKLMPENYKARGGQAIVFTLEAWDSNCPQHIPQRFEAVDAQAALDERDARIAALEAEAAALREKIESGA